MNYHEACAYLTSAVNFESRLHTLEQNDFSLGAFQKFLADLGNPQNSLRCIHVAGSKGKGSVCRSVAGILSTSGQRAGLFTSPHLYDVRERIRILTPENASGVSGERPEIFSGMIPPERFAQIMGQIRSARETSRQQRPVTYFELLTAAAFLYFQQEEVDWVVLETGLGGRLDATNAALAAICAITLIDREHTHILGSSYHDIIREKAGIIKTGTRCVVVGYQQNATRATVEDVCVRQAERAGARICFVQRDMRVASADAAEGKLSWSVFHQGETYDGMTAGGPAAVENTALTIGIVRELAAQGEKIAKSDILCGIRDAVWPGRMEVLPHDPPVILDAAHTGFSARSLAREINRRYPLKLKTFILGLGKDKDQQGVLQEFAVLEPRVIITRSAHERAACLDEQRVKKYLNTEKVEKTMTVKGALERALKRGSEDQIIVISGSLYVVAEARRLLCGT
ncbi:MAG: bifunctional folylpolyglutamate synthase/dihydrofolate synthase [Candidatus Omnitrophota bacterium]